LPVEYGKIPRPIAVYTGAIDFWFDFGLVEYAARRMPEVSFVLIGPADLARTRMERLPNLYLLGRRSYQSLPPYVRYADVGIIPLNVTDYPALVNHVHPLKLYEYMACGLPVVAVAWDELRNINSPASLSHNPEEFVQRIHQALEQPGDPIQNRSFAGKADWMSRVAALVEELDL
jgi:glycosyltransferase involved in cell wall biosynthesis